NLRERGKIGLLRPERELFRVEIPQDVIRKHEQQEHNEDDSKNGGEIDSTESQRQISQRRQKIFRRRVNEFPNRIRAQVNVSDDEMDREQRDEEIFHRPIKNQTDHAAL